MTTLRQGRSRIRDTSRGGTAVLLSLRILTTFLQSLSRHDQRLFEDFDSGDLQRWWNLAMVRAGHGRLRRAGEHLDIGGSTGGGSRRLIDNWEMPDWREFLGEELPSS